MKRYFLVLLGLAAMPAPGASALASTADPSALPLELPPTTIQCVPYARETSGIAIYGDALTWWAQAESRYARGSVPRVGAVLAFSASAAMPSGHVGTVSRILGPRDILLDHANWSAPNMIENGVLARDVSALNDWSEVRVWYTPGNALGSRVNPAHGFIYPDGATPPPVRYASAAAVRPPTAKAKAKGKKDGDPFIVEYADADPVNLLPASFFKRR